MTTPDVAPRSLTENGYAVLRADTLACRLVPGARLEIAELCSQFDVSLGAVREALSRLTAEWLVESEAQKGFRVAPVSALDLDDLTRTRTETKTLCLRRTPTFSTRWSGRATARGSRGSSDCCRRRPSGTGASRCPRRRTSHDHRGDRATTGCPRGESGRRRAAGRAAAPPTRGGMTRVFACPA